MNFTSKILNHVVRVYPDTNVENLLGMYRTLFDTMGVAHLMPFPIQSNFEHMDPSVQQALVMDYYNTARLLKDIGALDGGVRLENARISHNAINFIFSYS